MSMNDYNYTITREGLRIVAESVRADVDGLVLPDEAHDEAVRALEAIDGALDNNEPLYVPFPEEVK